MVIGCIVAGGSGLRMGMDTPKQFALLCGRPVWLHTVAAFLPYVNGLVVGLPQAWLPTAQQQLEQHRPWLAQACTAGMPPVELVAGGSNRNQTLYNCARQAAQTLGAPEKAVFVTHDAVRPLVRGELIARHIDYLQKNPGAVVDTVIPATDTIVQSADGHRLDAMPPRSEIYLAQTPQTFSLGDYLQLVEHTPAQVLAECTDAVGLFARQNRPVHLEMGATDNLKLTYPADMLMAECLLQARQ